jgi:hypothetical protein
MTEVEIQNRVEALREDALSLARELSRYAAAPGMGYGQMLAAEEMQSVANALGEVQRSVSIHPPRGVSEAA